MAGKYKRVYLSAGSTIVGLFLILTIVGVQITSDGDKTCAGTLDDPCVSYLTIYNPTAKSIYIYNKEDIQLDFSPEIKSYELYVKYYGKWVYTNFTMDTRLSNIPDDRMYVFVFPRYSTKEFKLVGYKNSPSDTIKWGVGVLDDDYLDPTWLSVGINISVSDCKTIYKNKTEIIWANYTMYNRFDASCKSGSIEIDGDILCNNPYIQGGSNGTITYQSNETICPKDGIVRLDNNVISYPNRWCVINKKYENRVDCVAKNDGLHLANPEEFKGCKDEGGMDCIIHEIKDNNTYDVSYVNSDKYVKGEINTKEIELK